MQCGNEDQSELSVPIICALPPHKQSTQHSEGHESKKLQTQKLKPQHADDDDLILEKEETKHDNPLLIIVLL